MGGTVSVTIREENGTEHRMARWTNSLPRFVNNIRTYQKDSQHIQDYVSRDSDTWKEDNEGLAPVQYGLVVLDLKTDTILTMQGYTSFSYISGAGIRLSIDDRRFRDDDGPNEFDLFKELLYDGRVTSARSFNGPAGMTNVDLTNTKPCEVLKTFKSGVQGNGLEIVNIDPTPFVIEKFDESSQGAIDMKNRLAELGFQYTRKEDEIWREWIDERKEEEAEDSG